MNAVTPTRKKGRLDGDGGGKRRKEGRTAVYPKHHNLTQKGSPKQYHPLRNNKKGDKPKKTKTSFGLKRCFAKKRGGFLTSEQHRSSSRTYAWSANWMMLHLPLLPVASLHEISPRDFGRRDSMQYDSAYCAKSS